MENRDALPKNILTAITGFAIFTLLLHLFTNVFAGYGIFRDELYYLACSNRLDAGYVDQPPFSIFVLYLNKLVFGDSVFAIRFLPAVVSSVVVFFTGLMAYRMGGNIYGVSLASAAMTFCPIFIGMNAIYSMNSFDYLFWVLCYYIIILIIQREKNILWYLLGLTTGLGLLNKTGFLWFGAGLFLGLLVTSPKTFLRREIYLAGIIALIIFSPYIIWNIQNGFPHLEFIRNATKFKYAGITRIDFALGQILFTNPIAVIVWIPGLYFLLFNSEGKKYRIIGIIYLVSFLVLLINGRSKPEYLGTAYSGLFAAGGVILEKFFNRRNLRIIKYAIPSLIGIVCFIFVPVFLPVLPEERFISYVKTIGIDLSSNEGKELSELPQFYADMHGWENMAKTVSGVYEKLSSEERKNTIVLAMNYGEAGAVEYFRDKYPAPQVVSFHNNYWFWFDEIKKIPDVVIIIGGDIEDHQNGCGSVEKAAVIKSHYAMPYENDLPVYICRNIKVDLEKLHKNEKHFI